MRRVWVNGRFELLHVGHVRMLRTARQMGDHLTVGLNSDDSFRRLTLRKPFVRQDDRAQMLRSLRWVDEVIIYDELDPLSAISRFGPFVAIVKGEDYRGRDIPEHSTGIPIHYVNGGRTHTTDIIDAIIDHEDCQVREA